MSVARRIAMLFRIKATKALDRAEDPREVGGIVVVAHSGNVSAARDRT